MCAVVGVASGLVALLFHPELLDLEKAVYICSILLVVKVKGYVPYCDYNAVLVSQLL